MVSGVVFALASGGVLRDRGACLRGGCGPGAGFGAAGAGLDREPGVGAGAGLGEPGLGVEARPVENPGGLGGPASGAGVRPGAGFGAPGRECIGADASPWSSPFSEATLRADSRCCVICCAAQSGVELAASCCTSTTSKTSARWRHRGPRICCGGSAIRPWRMEFQLCWGSPAPGPTQHRWGWRSSFSPCGNATRRNAGPAGGVVQGEATSVSQTLQQLIEAGAVEACLAGVEKPFTL